jgi:uncharacterized protein YccT (UPF0319 family)
MLEIMEEALREGGRLTEEDLQYWFKKVVG